ncbi:MAG TPA: hypothetical protein VK171_01980 [Fimbriimonas sp.]|nr:hypothetical protein [Fimbriimonas sp.]
MEIRSAIKRQHHAGLAMLRQAIEVCPDDLWLSGEHPRTYWRIAYHAAGYAHLYLYEGMNDWKPWALARNECAVLEGDVEVMTPYTKSEMLDFVDLIVSEVDLRVDAIDIEAPHCGFTWYPNVTRLELHILSLRHLHGHIGQLHELLIARGLDVEWIGQVSGS